VEHPARYINGLGTTLTSLTLGFEAAWTGDLSRLLAVPFLQANTQLQALSIQCICEHMISLLRAVHPLPSLTYLTLAVDRAGDDQTETEMYAPLAETLIFWLVPLVSVEQVDLVHLWPELVSDTEKSRGQILGPMRVKWGGRVVETETQDMHSNWFQEGAYWHPQCYE